MTMSSSGLTQSQNISVQLVITFKVSNSLDPDKALIEYVLIWVQTVCKELSADDNVM